MTDEIDHLNAIMEIARLAAIEECAGVADRYLLPMPLELANLVQNGDIALSIATAIRGLKERP